MDRVMAVARELMDRGPLALGGLKAAFSGKHTGVAGQARMAHDQLLTMYLKTRESQEVNAAFHGKSPADPDEFLH